MTTQLNAPALPVTGPERGLHVRRPPGLPVPPGAPPKPGGGPENHLDLVVDGLRVAWKTGALAAQGRPGGTSPGGGQRWRSASPPDPDGASVNSCARLPA